MAYKALYRAYRPQTFDEVVGQKAIVKTLQNALRDNKIAHAYLFCGPRGTGKTSMARLFAKALNCSKGQGEQCNECENCLEVIKGTHPDVYEIDAASNSGVDNVRRLIEQVSFAPIMGRYKVYIIDEVHSMSPSAFNALLKTLEEPPENVVFILATTEPNKVLPTILSRVQRFDFSKVNDDDLITLMERVLGKEGIEYEKDALKVIARLSDGGCRDALSNLDQAVSYSGKNVTVEDVYDLFGLFRVDEEIELVKMIHLNDIKSALSFTKNRYQKGGDILRLHDDLINIYKDLLVFGTTRDPSLLTYLKPEEALKVLVTPQEIRSNLDSLIQARRDYKTVLNSYDHFEFTLIKLAMNYAAFASQPAPVVSVKEEQEKVEVIKTPEKAPEITKKIEVKPVVEEVIKPSQPAPSIKTISTRNVNMNEDAILEKGVTITPELIINIMVQGNKNLKKDFQTSWKDKLESLGATDDLIFISKPLAQTEVCVVANGVVVVNTFFNNAIMKINSVKGQEMSVRLLKQLFNFEGRIIALSRVEYIDYVNKFLNMSQANALPIAQKIVFDSPVKVDEPKKEPQTNAAAFLDSLKDE